MVAESDKMNTNEEERKRRGGGRRREEKEEEEEEYEIGMIVERIIEDVWFVGKIISYSKRKKECSIRYLDDDLLEENIPIDEIRLSSQVINEIEIKAERKNTLPKPLIGLVEDDSAVRSIHQPVAIVHNDSDTGQLSFLINLSFLCLFSIFL